MNIDEFWNVVERVHAASPSDMKRKCVLLEDELRRLPAEEVLSFGRHFADCFHKAYKWDIWGAAFVIKRGCSDDSFMDFRSTLISLGHAPFEAAMRDADSLADFNIEPAWATYEGYQYVPPKVYEEMKGDKESQSNKNVPQHPKEVEGVPFVEWEMSKRFPRLAEKYGFKDSDCSVEKEFAERLSKKEKIAARVKTIMLNAGVIPSSGLIPPSRVVLNLLRTGRSPKLSTHHFTWEIFDADEGHYWAAVAQLEKASAAELESRPDLKGIRLTLDLGAGGINDFEDWMRTLKQRGLA